MIGAARRLEERAGERDSRSPRVPPAAGRPTSGRGDAVLREEPEEGRLGAQGGEVGLDEGAPEGEGGAEGRGAGEEVEGGLLLCEEGAGLRGVVARERVVDTVREALAEAGEGLGEGGPPLGLAAEPQEDAPVPRVPLDGGARREGVVDAGEEAPLGLELGEGLLEPPRERVDVGEAHVRADDDVPLVPRERPLLQLDRLAGDGLGARQLPREGEAVRELEGDPASLRVEGERRFVGRRRADEVPLRDEEDARERLLRGGLARREGEGPARRGEGLFVAPEVEVRVGEAALRLGRAGAERGGPTEGVERPLGGLDEAEVLGAVLERPPEGDVRRDVGRVEGRRPLEARLRALERGDAPGAQVDEPLRVGLVRRGDARLAGGRGRAGRLPRRLADRRREPGQRRSWRVKRSPVSPSTFTERRTSAVPASARRAVIRSLSPTRWNPPDATQLTPSLRPASSARPGRSAPRSATRCRRISWTRSVATTEGPPEARRSAASVSASATPSQSSSGRAEMFVKATTATVAGHPSPLPREGRRPWRAAARASAAARIEGGRRERSFSSIRATASESASGMAGFARTSGSGWCPRTEARTAPTVAPGKARRPARSSQRTAPREKTSLLPSSSSPLTCSGDMYAAVPAIPGDGRRAASPGVSVSRASWSRPVHRVARPKSTSLARPAATRMFEGFTSRWTIPFP